MEVQNQMLEKCYILGGAWEKFAHLMQCAQHILDIPCLTENPLKKMYMLVIDCSRNKSCFVLLNAPSPWASPEPAMPRLFLLSTLLFMTFHILYICGFFPVPRKIHLWPSQPYPPSPVILSPDRLSPSWAWSLGFWEHEGEECPLLCCLISCCAWPIPRPEATTAERLLPLSAAHGHNLCCIALQPQWKETDQPLPSSSAVLSTSLTKWGEDFLPGIASPLWKGKFLETHLKLTCLRNGRAYSFP